MLLSPVVTFQDRFRNGVPLPLDTMSNSGSSRGVGEGDSRHEQAAMAVALVIDIENKVCDLKALLARMSVDDCGGHGRFLDATNRVVTNSTVANADGDDTSVQPDSDNKDPVTDEQGSEDDFDIACASDMETLISIAPKLAKREGRVNNYNQLKNDDKYKFGHRVYLQRYSRMSWRARRYTNKPGYVIGHTAKQVTVVLCPLSQPLESLTVLTRKNNNVGHEWQNRK